jgi:hypothetical protein
VISQSRRRRRVPPRTRQADRQRVRDDTKHRKVVREDQAVCERAGLSRGDALDEIILFLLRFRADRESIEDAAA